MLLSDAVDEYLEDKAKRLRGNTLEGYISALRRHVLPAFGSREVEEITHDEVQAWVDSIPTYGAAGKAYKTLRQVYRWVVRKHLELFAYAGIDFLYLDYTNNIWYPEATFTLLDAILESGARVPEDYSLCGFDNIFPARLARVSLTTVEHHIAEKGRHALDILHQRISNGPGCSVTRVEILPELIVRNSTGPARMA